MLKVNHIYPSCSPHLSHHTQHKTTTNVGRGRMNQGLQKRKKEKLWRNRLWSLHAQRVMMRKRRNLETDWGQNPRGNNQQDPPMRKAASQSQDPPPCRCSRMPPTRTADLRLRGTPDIETRSGAHVHLTHLQPLSPWSPLPPATILVPVAAQLFCPPPNSPPHP